MTVIRKHGMKSPNELFGIKREQSDARISSAEREHLRWQKCHQFVLKIGPIRR